MDSDDNELFKVQGINCVSWNAHFQLLLQVGLLPFLLQTYSVVAFIPNYLQAFFFSPTKLEHESTWFATAGRFAAPLSSSSFEWFQD